MLGDRVEQDLLTGTQIVAADPVVSGQAVVRRRCGHGTSPPRRARSVAADASDRGGLSGWPLGVAEKRGYTVVTVSRLLAPAKPRPGMVHRP
ncbi:hypothetical protein GCM10012285_13770 [Streptomyces kronopolitis]|uniref:Uncharacterized protein n=1 Tax=Streptomyces kronopolitis TaxID=1612435 RepID=A0ABQ2J4I1_9ACTN|nr:hypothetical protein GCM10012285_13770 [Streptomyces kronopolitis]